MNEPVEEKAPVPQEAPVVKPEDNTVLMSVLAYIGILILIPYFTAKQNPVVRYHIQQGMVLFALEVILWVASEMFWTSILGLVISVANIALLVLSIVGIVNVLNKKQEPLPIVGQYAKHFPI